MGHLESGEKWKGFDCSQVRVRPFSFALPPDSIELPTSSRSTATVALLSLILGWVET